MEGHFGNGHLRNTEAMPQCAERGARPAPTKRVELDGVLSGKISALQGEKTVSDTGSPAKQVNAKSYPPFAHLHIQHRRQRLEDV
jgi:hypothetical protein